MESNLNCSIKRFLVAASIALAVPLTAVAFGGKHGACSFEANGGQGHPLMGGDMPLAHLRGLALSEVQRDKVFEIMHAQAPLMRDKTKILRKVEDDLRRLIAGPDYSEAQVRSLADTAAKAVVEMTLLRAKADRQVVEVLTPEQRQQLAERTLDRAPRQPAPGA